MKSMDNLTKEELQFLKDLGKEEIKW